VVWDQMVRPAGKVTCHEKHKKARKGGGIFVLFVTRKKWRCGPDALACAAQSFAKAIVGWTAGPSGGRVRRCVAKHLVSIRTQGQTQQSLNVTKFESTL
jgi:hypothetical protein